MNDIGVESNTASSTEQRNETASAPKRYKNMSVIEITYKLAIRGERRELLIHTYSRNTQWIILDGITSKRAAKPTAVRTGGNIVALDLGLLSQLTGCASEIPAETIAHTSTASGSASVSEMLQQSPETRIRNRAANKHDMIAMVRAMIKSKRNRHAYCLGC